MLPTKATPRPVTLKRKSLERYREIVSDDVISELRDLAHGLRLLEVSVTATGGGVGELSCRAVATRQTQKAPSKDPPDQSSLAPTTELAGFMSERAVDNRY